MLDGIDRNPEVDDVAIDRNPEIDDVANEQTSSKRQLPVGFPTDATAWISDNEIID